MTGFMHSERTRHSYVKVKVGGEGYDFDLVRMEPPRVTGHCCLHTLMGLSRAYDFALKC